LLAADRASYLTRPDLSETGFALEDRQPGSKDLNFKVAADFHRLFKTTAAEHGMAMRELLEAALQVWLEKKREELAPSRLAIIDAKLGRIMFLAAISVALAALSAWLLLTR